MADSATPGTVARWFPPSMGSSRQEYWSGWPFPSPGELPNPGIEPGFPALQADSLPSEPLGKPQVDCSFPKQRLKRSHRERGEHGSPLFLPWCRGPGQSPSASCYLGRLAAR